MAQILSFIKRRRSRPFRSARLLLRQRRTASSPRVQAILGRSDWFAPHRLFDECLLRQKGVLKGKRACTNT